MQYSISRGAVALAAMIGLAASAPDARAQATPDFRTWLFAEGSTNGTFGFEQEVLIGNPNATPVDVTIEMFSQDGTNLGEHKEAVAPLSRKGVYVRSIAGDQAGVALRVTAPLPIVAERSMYWGNALYRQGRSQVGKVNDMRGGHNERGVDSGSTRWLFAEGEARFFWTFFAVANPNDAPATVTATYLDLNGNEVRETRTVRARGRETFWPSDPAFLRSAAYANRTGGFSTIIESVGADGVRDDADLPVIAERQMYWGPGGRYDGGHAALGIKAPATDWFFAEGFQGGGTNFDTWLLVLNPNPAPMAVTFTFYDTAGQVLATSVREVGARARAQVWAGEFDALRGKAFSTRVTSASEFAAERAVYWRGYAEGHATAGATQRARKWGFAEGLQGGFLLYQDDNDLDKRRFNTFYAVFNPNPVAATVTFDFYVESATGNVGKRLQQVVPANSRYTLWTLEVPELANQKFAAFLSADQEIVAERVVYWGANFRSGHASLGTPLSADFPILAAANLPGAPAATLTVTPNRGAPSGGTRVLIEGAGFGHTELGTQVFFGATPATAFEVENDAMIRAVAPPGATGSVDVSVVTNGTTTTAPQAFRYFDKNAAAGPPWGRYNGVFSSFCRGDGSGCAEMPASINGFNLLAVLGGGSGVDLLNSCREHPGGNNNYLFEAVARLRLATGSNRWGLNWKRGNRGDMSQDVFTYFFGEEGENMRDSAKVYLVDMIAGHCGDWPSVWWEGVTFKTFGTRFTGSNAGWTTDPMCALPRYRDARYPNGEWLFPECRP